MNSSISAKNVSIVIVHKTGKQMLVDCLMSIQKSTQFKEIIIVANDSDAASKKYLHSIKSKECQVIFNDKNNGFAEANNQGFKLATGKFVLFLNNDTLVTKDFLKPLLSRLVSKHDLAAVQPIILFPNKTIDSIGSYLTPTGFLYHKAHRQKISEQNCQPAKVYSLKGACMLWKKSVLDSIGVFAEDYFAYFEETELCHRALNKGFTLEFVPHSVIIHFGGFTSNKMNQAFIQFYNTKNRIQTYLKHLPLQLLYIVFVQLLLTQLLIIKTAFSNLSVAIAIQKGIWQGLLAGLTARKSSDNVPLNTLLSVIKKPDYTYYLALFSSLEKYNKLW